MRTFFGLPNIQGNRELTGKESSAIMMSKRNLYKEIFNLSYYSKGAFNWEIIYNMPIWVRSLNIKFLNDAREAENKQATASGSGSGKTIARPPKLGKSVSRPK